MTKLKHDWPPPGSRIEPDGPLSIHRPTNDVQIQIRGFTDIDGDVRRKP
jgi:hypothetical protein